jgi:hypothetical protein
VYDTRKNPLLSREPPTRRTAQNPRGRLPCMDSALHANAPPVSGGPAHGARFVCVGNGSPSTSEPEPIVNTCIIRGGNPYLHEMCGQLGVRSYDTLCAVHQFPHARLVYTAELRQAIAAAIGTNFVRVSALQIHVVWSHALPVPTTRNPPCAGKPPDSVSAVSAAKQGFSRGLGQSPNKLEDVDRTRSRATCLF